MPFFSDLLTIYFVAVLIVAAIMTLADKFFAKKGMWRIPEATLMLVGFLGGALSMYITMRTIRHKTKHKKFMIGLPIMIALHVACAAAWIFAFYI
ncbi:MAG: DUF1294 domain-containing protein [Clostridia bacterium]|nr:DUF1294 domain-containing protein [Clostridia bacterium]